MLLIITIIILITSLGYFFPKSKAIFIVELLQLIVIIGGYNGKGDLDNYQLRYNSGLVSNNISERLYDYTATLFKNLNFSFEIFHLLITTFSLILISFVIFKISKLPAQTMSMIVGFTTLEYALQIKALIAASILTYSLYYFYKNCFRRNNIYKNIVFLFLIMLATGFHFLSYFFPMFLILRNIRKRQIYIFTAILIISINIMLPLILSQMSKFITAINYYNGNERTFLVTCIFTFWQLLLVFLTKFSIKELKNENNYFTKEEILFLEFVEYGNLVLLLIVPFYSITSVVNRFLRIWSVFYYSLVSYFPIRNNYIVTYQSKTLIIFYGIVSFLLYYVVSADFSGHGYNVLVDVLEHNIFWQLNF